MRNKRDQIIWRDLYHLQDHAKSFIDWSAGKNLMRKVQTEEQNHLEVIIKRQSSNDQGIIDLSSKILIT